MHSFYAWIYVIVAGVVDSLVAFAHFLASRVAVPVATPGAHVNDVIPSPSLFLVVIAATAASLKRPMQRIVKEAPPRPP